MLQHFKHFQRLLRVCAGRRLKGTVCTLDDFVDESALLLNPPASHEFVQALGVEAPEVRVDHFEELLIELAQNHVDVFLFVLEGSLGWTVRFLCLLGAEHAVRVRVLHGHSFKAVLAKEFHRVERHGLHIEKLVYF